ncbi:MAG: GreA/GreB family elongation factor, partial [Acidiferrobacteraceae bacterium]
ADLEAKLSNAQIIDPLTVNANGKVVFGATLDLLDEESQQEVTYQIVGDEEADISEGKISISSPIARALIGKEAGELVEVRVPDGVRQYEILGIRYV